MYRDRMAAGDISHLAAREEAGAAEPVEQEVARLRKEVAQLRRANEILKTASASFAAAELDRRLGQ